MRTSIHSKTWWLKQPPSVFVTFFHFFFLHIIKVKQQAKHEVLILRIWDSIWFTYKYQNKSTHTSTGTHTDAVCRQNNKYRHHTLSLSLSSPSSLLTSLHLQPYNEPCCTVLFTPASYQWYSSTEAANWRGQTTVLPVPCSGVGVYRHAPSTFISRRRERLGLCQAASQNNNAHSRYTNTHRLRE